MAYQGSKGWYIARLKEEGIFKHPIDLLKLELYKTFEVRKIYLDVIATKMKDKQQVYLLILQYIAIELSFL